VDSAYLATIAADDPTLPTATLQALAPGEVTITATSSLGTAQAKATIFDVGLMPAGTASWGFYPETQDNFFDFKIKSRRNSESDPFLYIPEGTDDFTHLNALSENGQLMWRVTLNPVDPSNTFSFPDGAAGTNDGGVLVHSVETGGPNDAFTALYRFGPDHTLRWTYRSASFGLSEPAIGPDGTIYVLDLPILIAIDDTTGTEKFRFVPAGGSSTITSAEQPGTTNPDGTQVKADNPWKPCADFFAPGTFHPPSPTPPGLLSFNSVIGTDGSAYLMSTVVFSSFSYDKCQIVQVGTDPATNNPIYNITSMSGQLQYNSSVQLVRVTSSGDFAATQIGSISYSGQASVEPGAFNTIQWTFNNGASQLPQIRFDQVVPDADGGALITWLQQSSILGDHFHGFLTKVLNDSPVSTQALTASGVMAINDQGTVFFSESGVSVTAVDIASGIPKWTLPGTLLSATDDGGALLQLANFSIVYADANGNLSPDVMAALGTASYMSVGAFQVTGLGGSVTAVSTDQTTLKQLTAVPWPVPAFGNPATQHQAQGISASELKETVFNESDGCTGFDYGQAKHDLPYLMAPIGTTEQFVDGSGNLVTNATPAVNVVNIKNNTGHPVRLFSYVPAVPNLGLPARPDITVSIQPDTLPADGNSHAVTFTGLIKTDRNQPAHVKVVDTTNNNDLGDALALDVMPWRRWQLDLYPVSGPSGNLGPTPPDPNVLQTELKRIFERQANLGFTLKSRSTVADAYDVNHDGKMHIGKITSGPQKGQNCFLGDASLSVSATCPDDTELTPMYLRLVSNERQQAGGGAIDLDLKNVFSVLFFNTLDGGEAGGWAHDEIESRKAPAIIQTVWPTLPSGLLINSDRFLSTLTAHEIDHKLGNLGIHHFKPEPNWDTFLMLRRVQIDFDTLSHETDIKKYPCRLSRSDWIHANWEYQNVP
jgi:outer membrane protein assembly factor BamB